MFVTFFQRQDLRQGTDKIFNNIYVKDLPTEFDDDQLENLFKTYGKIISTKLVKDENGKSKGFGFVCFEETDDAATAVKELNGKEINEKTIFVGRAQKKAERQKNLRIEHEKKKQQQGRGNNLYIKFLDDAVNDEMLKTEFSKYGEVQSAKVETKIARGEDNIDKEVSAGFGFVSYKDPNSARLALDMNGKVFFGKPLYVTYAQPKGTRKQLLQSYFSNRMSGPNKQRGPFMNNQPMMGGPYMMMNQPYQKRGGYNGRGMGNMGQQPMMMQGQFPPNQM